MSRQTYDARQPHVIVTGNPVDGLNFIGPFPNSASAIESADNDGRLDADWWIAPLERPEAEGAAAASSDRALEPGKDDPSGILREFVADCLAAGQNDFDEACSIYATCRTGRTSRRPSGERAPASRLSTHFA